MERLATAKFSILGSISELGNDRCVLGKGILRVYFHSEAKQSTPRGDPLV